MRCTLKSNKYYTAFFNRFSLELGGVCVRECSQAGAVDAYVSRWVRHVKRPTEITPEALAAELKEYGAWSAEELADDAANWERLIWMAACNIKEEENK